MLVRCHLNLFHAFSHLCSILVPLFASVVLWASNGRFKVEFIDALYICVSAVTGTGLSTVDLSSLTAWQQTILFVLELAGNQARTMSPRIRSISNFCSIRSSYPGSSSSSGGAHSLDLAHYAPRPNATRPLERTFVTT